MYDLPFVKWAVSHCKLCRRRRRNFFRGPQRCQKILFGGKKRLESFPVNTRHMMTILDSSRWFQNHRFHLF